jgi:gamma-glutamylcyclotransferase (GGCT)/AIG2-like uncharacterized protein YtfP
MIRLGHHEPRGDHDGLDTLFAYGLLMPRQPLFHRIATHVRSARPGRVTGQLIDLGAYPALIPGDGIVRGSLLEIDTDALWITDQIEGYLPGRETNLYIRERITVTLATGGVEEAWVYRYARPVHDPDPHALVIGEWEGRPVYRWRRSP